MWHKMNESIKNYKISNKYVKYEYILMHNFCFIYIISSPSQFLLNMVNMDKTNKMSIKWHLKYFDKYHPWSFDRLFDRVYKGNYFFDLRKHLIIRHLTFFIIYLKIKTICDN